ncbi:Golgin subfamily A member 7 [Cricetulus griseus]|uniref:Golgin subfamily A member 7 n=1 Tax=Cricetulus griseus TaxID=10029 RepID=G3HHI6_CRIGR|nr:Golgin subfamily A member 7 [Cricetulus griseus]ERE92462.1 golgin subfamily A member 7-like protein [Cricetulus griseus]
MRPQQAPVSGKVFIQRDYSSGTRCQFQTKFPAELENRIDRQQFEETVRTLNNLYAEAEKLGGQSYLEGCLACLTAYTIFLCMETHYEKIPPPAGTFVYPLANGKVSLPPLQSVILLYLLPEPRCHTWSDFLSLSIHFVSPNCVGLCNF